MCSFVLIGFSKWRKQLMRKTSVSLLPRGQWVCDKSRAFCVRIKKGTHPHFGVFSYLLGVFPQENNIKLGILHDKREIIP